MRLNKSEDLKTIRDEVISNLNDLLEKHGIRASIPGSMSFDRDGEFVSFKVELVAGRSKEEKALEAHADRDGITRFKGDVMGIGECVITGYNTRARKYPYIVRRVEDGKSFKIPTLMARAAFA